jgi:hypothetical protein
MHICEMNLRTENGVIRAEARVLWEDSDRQPFVLFIDTEERPEQEFWPDPNAFLIACLLPAWRAGERRVKIGGSICPVLSGNLRSVLSTLNSWYPEQFGPAPTIQPQGSYKALCPLQTRALSLLSCGVDSLATLRWNKLNIPSDHPASIKGAVLISHDDDPELSAERLTGEAQGRLPAALEVAADAEVDVMPVRTNMWWLVNDGYFYDEKWHGAALSSVACLFSRHFNKAYIASSYHAADLHPWGSHPLLDPYYSSSHFRIEHHGLEMTRLEKTALVADWPVGLQNIRVCQNDDSGASNCGQCEKCVRTMTTLVALGKLEHSAAFPLDDVTPELLGFVEEQRMIHSPFQAQWYRELIPLLVSRGRGDLVVAIERMLRPYSQEQSNGQNRIAVRR